MRKIKINRMDKQITLQLTYSSLKQKISNTNYIKTPKSEHTFNVLIAFLL